MKIGALAVTPTSTNLENKKPESGCCGKRNVNAEPSSNEAAPVGDVREVTISKIIQILDQMGKKTPNV